MSSHDMNKPLCNSPRTTQHCGVCRLITGGGIIKAYRPNLYRYFTKNEVVIKEV